MSPCIGALTRTKQPRPRVNRKQRMKEAKVVDSIDMEDLDKKLKAKDGTVSFCRCWKSNKVISCVYILYKYIVYTIVHVYIMYMYSCM